MSTLQVHLVAPGVELMSRLAVFMVLFVCDSQRVVLAAGDLSNDQIVVLEEHKLLWPELDSFLLSLVS